MKGLFVTIKSSKGDVMLHGSELPFFHMKESGKRSPPHEVFHFVKKLLLLHGQDYDASQIKKRSRNMYTFRLTPLQLAAATLPPDAVWKTMRCFRRPLRCEGVTLASGGFGKVVQHGRTAVKLMYDRGGCTEARKEFFHAQQVARALAEAQGVLGEEFPKILCAPEPLKFCDKELRQCNQTFSCALISRLIVGVPLAGLPGMERGAALMFPRALVLPNYSGHSSLSLKNQAQRAHPEENVPRYFMLSAEKVEEALNIPDFEQTFPVAMGTLLAVFTFGAQLSMIDVEVLLGGDLKAHVLDFGMCQDISRLVSGRDAAKLAMELADLGSPFFAKVAFPTPQHPEALRIFMGAFRRTCVKVYDLDPGWVDVLVKKLQEEL